MEFPKDVLVAHLFKKKTNVDVYLVIEGAKVKMKGTIDEIGQPIAEQYWKEQNALLFDVFGSQKELLQAIIKTEVIEELSFTFWKETLILQHPELFASIVGGERSPFSLKGIFYVDILNQRALYRKKDAVNLIIKENGSIEMNLDPK